jgi:hypothetical protein
VTKTASKKAVLAIGKVRRHGRRVTVTLRAGVALKRVRVTLRDRRGHVRAKGSRAKLPPGTRRIVVRAKRRLGPGRYRLRVTARTQAGKTVAAKRRLRVSAR